MSRPTHPSNLELQALSVLWHEGPSTVAAILETYQRPDGTIAVPGVLRPYLGHDVIAPA